jgi:hypothetical protein
MIMPGVQKPHCRPCSSQKPVCSGCNFALARPSMVVTSTVGLHREQRAGLGAAAVDEHGAGAALAGVAADVCASEVEVLAQEMDEEQAGLHVRLAQLAVDGDGDLDHEDAIVVLTAFEVQGDCGSRGSEVRFKSSRAAFSVTPAPRYLPRTMSVRWPESGQSRRAGGPSRADS